MGDEGGGGSGGSSSNFNQMETSIGKKDFYRSILSLSIMNVARLCADLEMCIQFGCPRPNETYRSFVSEFNALWLTVGMFTNNLELAKRVEKELQRKWTYRTRAEFENNSQIYTNIFKELLIQLKEDGLYNPEIVRKNVDYEDVWSESIGG